MNLSPTSLLDHLKSNEGRKQLRYALVSVIFVPLGQAFVQFFHWVSHLNPEPSWLPTWMHDWSDPTSILVTACLLTVPNYFANKLYVWKDNTNDKMKTQITVFWVAAMLGTAFAMGLAGLADHLTKNMQTIWQAIWLFVAQLTGYGIVWIGRYFFLDKLIFKATHHGVEPSAEDLEDLHHEFPI